MATLPIADVPLDGGTGAEVVRRSARLTCRSADFAELAEVLAVGCGPLSYEEERTLRAGLDALIAHLYCLSEEHLELVLADFWQSAGAEGSPVRPDEDYKDLVRREFAQLNSVGTQGTA
jgi:hypothetical protein